MTQSTPQAAETTRAALQAPGPRGGARIERAARPAATLSRLWMEFRESRGRLAFVGLLVVSYTLLGLCGPYLMGHAIDVDLRQRDVRGLARTAAWMLGSYVASNALQLLSSWLMASISQGALRRIRARLFRHLQSLPVRFFDRQASGDLMSRLTNDVEAINQAVSQNITALLASVLSMFGIIVAMFVLDRWLALASLLVVPLMLWFTRFVALYTRRGFRDLQRVMGGLNAVMEETISGQKVVKAFRRDDAAVANFRRHNQEAYRVSVYANTYALLLMPLTAVLGNLFVIVLTGLGGWLALRGLVSVGIIATFINYGQNFVNPLRQLSNLYNTIQAALAGAERVFQVMDEEPEQDAGRAHFSGPVRGHVRFEHVAFGYRSDRLVLEDLSLEAQPGELVALVGPTGAGKTTVINLLTRFYELTAGRISIDGVDIRELPKAELRRQLGIVLQDTFLFSGSVLENIRYGRLAASDEEVMEAARLAEADPFIRQLPDGYQTQLAERGGNLSQGQRQLLAIARTLLADPAILILDEATSSVDTRTEAHLQQSLLRLMRGRTSFVIAHRLSTIRDANQVLVVQAGRVIERGTHRSLLQSKGFYHQLYVSQFKGQAL